MTQADFDDLAAMLQDPEVMYAYEHDFSDEDVQVWLDRQRGRYEKYGFGLWAMILKETGEMIGDCGLTMQPIDGQQLPEIGYHIHKDHWRKGYGSEAAKAVRDWAFQNTKFDCLYSYMTSTNLPSYSTAASAGLRKIKEYSDKDDGILYVYAITREAWEAEHQ